MRPIFADFIRLLYIDYEYVKKHEDVKGNLILILYDGY